MAMLLVCLHFNLDSRYYTEAESDTLFTKKVGQGIISGGIK